MPGHCGMMAAIPLIPKLFMMMSVAFSLLTVLWVLCGFSITALQSIKAHESTHTYALQVMQHVWLGAFGRL
jgi:ammonia channel protein AmtB